MESVAARHFDVQELFDGHDDAVGVVVRDPEAGNVAISPRIATPMTKQRLTWLLFLEND